MKLSLADKFASFSDHWNPRVVAELNGQQVKLVKFEPAGTLNTGNVESERTVREPSRI